ncbi:hypothetical protein D9619_006947 [Psilocybe cf. subviscida]|uniref:V-type proton ATPase subunit C n=1 Tax=Psilocybe cf. subviscida TaxID=2480587 RepID=A0A8H5B1L3_9AGAR|nr:hypothetical protein D9619_006947 [Psilocybe cf. subviscida]
MSSDLCPVYAPFFSAMGCTSAIVFTCIGARFVLVLVSSPAPLLRIPQLFISLPQLASSPPVMCVVPVIMAGIIAIYGLVVSVLISSDLSTQMSLAKGFTQLGAGLSVGLAGLAAGFAVGIVGDAGVRGTAQQPRLFVGMILILIFAEVLGLYGLIVALIMNTKASGMEALISRRRVPMGIKGAEWDSGSIPYHLHGTHMHPDASSFEITTFLRSADKAEKLKALGVKTIVGSFVDDRDTFVEAVSASDVVIAVASSDDLPIAQAVLEGHKKYHQKTGKVPTLIHTSGTAFIVDDARGLTAEHVSFSDLEVDRLNAIPETALHRHVDIPLIEADKEGYVKTYIVTPGTLFGYPTGPVKDAGIQNIHSIQLPWVIRPSIQRKQGAYFGKGLNKWSAADVNETAEIFILILDAIRSNAPGVGHGAEGYYFAEHFEYSGYEAAEAIAEALHEHGAAPTPEPSAFSLEEAEKYFGPVWPLLATNCYAKGERARALGWKPVKGLQDLLANVKEEVAALLAEAQKN